MSRFRQSSFSAKSLRQFAVRLAIPGAALFAFSAPAETGFAQLRTGRTERPMYHQDLGGDQGNSVVSTRPSVPRRVPARLAAGQSRESSILEGGVPVRVQGNAAAPVQPPAEKPVPETVPQPVPDAAADQGSAPMILEDGMSYESMGHGSSGCGCDSCSSGDFHHLAPGVFGDGCGSCQGGCHGACDGGCHGICSGPLARLISRLSVRAEVPLFWRRAQGIPTLVTSANAGTAANVAGQIGQASTLNLLGPGIVDEDNSNGVRITVGTWTDPVQYRGIIARYTNAGKQTDDFAFNSNRNAILARPFTNITTGTAVQDTQLIAFPNTSTGAIGVNIQSEVDAFDIVLRRLAYKDRFTRVDWLAGYQHNNVEESLAINSSTTVIDANSQLFGTSIAVVDQFRTTNQFHGGVLGVMSTRQFAYWQFEALFRMGLGNMNRRVEASGSTTTTSAGGVATTEAQGLLVRNTNNQTVSDSTFVLVPEVGFNAGYCLTRNLDFTIGYNYLLLPKVAQVGQQIDTTVNLSDPLTGALRPQTLLVDQKYWLQSLNLGLQWKY